MLRAIQIENYALIRFLKISFDGGFTVITGETGAGKSILMGALSLVLGNRADSGILYDKTKKCIVEGTFDIRNLPLHSFFTKYDLDYQEETLIRREINEQGKSRAFINDTPATLNALKELTAQLIDIHSQHQNLLLQDAGFRTDLIDQYAHNQSLLTQYQQSLHFYKERDRQYRQLKELCDRERQQQDYNTFTYQELETAQLSPTDQEDTEQAIRLLSNAENIKNSLFQAAQRLSEQENDTILQQLKAVETDCAQLNTISPDYQNISDRLSAVEIELKDLAYEIVRKEAVIEVNPQELDKQNERLNLLYSLQQKHQVTTVPALIELKNKLHDALTQITDHQEQLAAIDKERAQLFHDVQKAAEALTKSRKAVIIPLQKEMCTRLERLNMPDSRFEIRLQSTDDLQPNGTDKVEFFFSANKGISPADLSKVASGGEMSRLMLALKSIITDSVLLPTVIFDEIDTGISGETANKVGEVMKEMAKHHQLIVITHLPQIAVRATEHYLVYKETVKQTTETSLRLLSADERTEAVAVMLSGFPVTAAARTTAREMLNQNKS